MRASPIVSLPSSHHSNHQRCIGIVATTISAFVAVVTWISATTVFSQPFVTAVGDAATIVHSNDGGATWGQQQTALNPDPAQRDLLAVDFVDPQTGWTSGMFSLVDVNSYLYTMRYTINGGASWPSADFGPFQHGFLANGLDFVDHNSGWVVGGSGGGGPNIWRSDDGGRSWTPQVSGEQAFDFNAVKFVDQNHGWAVGGTIVHTTDGGSSWHTEYRTDAALPLLGADFVDQNTGWAVGTSNQLIHTSDGGATWTSQPHPFVDSLRDVVFPTPTDGWIVGSNGTILHTNDAGNTWAPQVSGTTATLNAVDFISAVEGWAAGEAGTILHTADGGLTWQAQISGTNRTLNDIAAVVPEPSAIALFFIGGVAIASFACGRRGRTIQS